jgi:hypothetical protein
MKSVYDIAPDHTLHAIGQGTIQISNHDEDLDQSFISLIFTRKYEGSLRHPNILKNTTNSLIISTFVIEFLIKIHHHFQNYDLHFGNIVCNSVDGTITDLKIADLGSFEDTRYTLIAPLTHGVVYDPSDIEPKVRQRDSWGLGMFLALAWLNSTEDEKELEFVVSTKNQERLFTFLNDNLNVQVANKIRALIEVCLKFDSADRFGFSDTVILEEIIADLKAVELLHVEIDPLQEMIGKIDLMKVYDLLNTGQIRLIL